MASRTHDSIFDFAARFYQNEEACREYLAKILWKGGKPRCPHCGFNDKIYTYTTRQVYKCGSCMSQFRLTTGTIFENSKIPLYKWFMAIYLICSNKKGITSIQLARELKIAQRNAWHIAHKIRKVLKNNGAKKMLAGIVEVDETYIGGKKKGGKRGRGTEKTKVFGMLERSGEIRMVVVEDVSSYTLHPIIYDNIEIGSCIMSDEWKAYNKLDDYYARGVINHGRRHYADGEIHVNSLEGAWGLLKRGLKGIYHRPSKKYMNNYCGEFEFKYNNRKISVPLLFKKAVKQSKVRVRNTTLS